MLLRALIHRPVARGRLRIGLRTRVREGAAISVFPETELFKASDRPRTHALFKVPFLTTQNTLLSWNHLAVRRRSCSARSHVEAWPKQAHDARQQDDPPWARLLCRLPRVTSVLSRRGVAQLGTRALQRLFESWKPVRGNGIERRRQVEGVALAAHEPIVGFGGGQGALDLQRRAQPLR